MDQQFWLEELVYKKPTIIRVSNVFPQGAGRDAGLVWERGGKLVSLIFFSLWYGSSLWVWGCVSGLRVRSAGVGFVEGRRCSGATWLVPMSRHLFAWSG